MDPLIYRKLHRSFPQNHKFIFSAILLICLLSSSWGVAMIPGFERPEEEKFNDPNKVFTPRTEEELRNETSEGNSNANNFSSTKHRGQGVPVIEENKFDSPQSNEETSVTSPVFSIQRHLTMNTLPATTPQLSPASSWNLLSLDDFRAIGNDAKGLDENQSLHLVQDEYGIQKGVFINASTMTPLSETEANANAQARQAAVEAFARAIINANNSKGILNYSFPPALKEEALEKGLTPRLIQQVFEEIDIPSQNNALNQVVLKNFENLLEPYHKNLEPHLANIDPELLKAFNTNIGHFSLAHDRGYLLQALSYKNLIEQIQHGINAQIELLGLSDQHQRRISLENVITIIKKLIPLHKNLIEAQAAGNKEEVERLTPLVKAYQVTADLRISIAAALQKGDSEKAQQLLSSDLDEIFEKIETFRSFELPPPHPIPERLEVLQILHKELITTYSSMIQCRSEALKAIAPNKELRPLLAQAWLDIDTLHQKATSTLMQMLNHIAQEQYAFNMSLHFILAGSAIACNHAATQIRESARAIQRGNLSEATQHQEIAQDYKNLADEGFFCHQAYLNNSFLAGRKIWNFTSFQALADQRKLTNQLLAQEIDGVRSWKREKLPDFNERFVAAFHLEAFTTNPSREFSNMIESYGEKQVKSLLVEDLEIMEKMTLLQHEATLALITIRDGETPAFRENLSRTWISAYKAYGNCINEKRCFYRGAAKNLSGEYKLYHFSRAEQEEYSAKNYTKAAQAYAAHHDNLATRYIGIADLQHSMELKKADIFSLGFIATNLFPVWNKMERVIILKTQAIEALERGDTAEASRLDAESAPLEVEAQEAMREMNR